MTTTHTHDPVAELLATEVLTPGEKVEALRRLEYDARELLVADEENMGAAPSPDRTSPAERLVRIRAALRTLVGDGVRSVRGCTKHGG